MKLTMKQNDTLTSESADLLEAPKFFLRLTQVVLILFLSAFIAWAAFAQVEQSTRADGNVIPAGKVQVVQNLEGGIISVIHVQDGDTIEAGEPLVEISTAQASSSLKEAEEKIVGYEGAIVRLEAERDDVAPQFDAEFIAKYPAVVNGQIGLHEARQNSKTAFLAEQDSEIAQRQHEISEQQSKAKSAKSRLELAQSERNIIAPLVKRGAAPKLELLTLERQITEIKEGIATAENAVPRLKAAIQSHKEIKTRELSRLRSDLLNELNETRTALSALKEAIKGTQDQLKRAIVRSPVAGTVKSINVNTLGQVISSGVDIVEIIPADDSLLIEGRVPPQDIAFLRPDLETNIRMTAYDFSIYGSLKGKLESISADSIEDDEGNRFYRIKVRADKNVLERDGESFPIIPGMTAEINIVTGERTILEYMMKPVVKTLSRSLHER
ncbi:MAG: HlyD family type I secretion periplasmic adaptor subunit [Hyphomicrobiales bacterium]